MTPVSVRTFGVMYDHTLNFLWLQIISSDIRKHCQNGDCRWPLNLPHMGLSEYVWVNIPTSSTTRVQIIIMNPRNILYLHSVCLSVSLSRFFSLPSKPTCRHTFPPCFLPQNNIPFFLHRITQKPPVHPQTVITNEKS